MTIKEGVALDYNSRFQTRTPFVTGQKVVLKYPNRKLQPTTVIGMSNVAARTFWGSAS